MQYMKRSSALRLAARESLYHNSYDNYDSDDDGSESYIPLKPKQYEKGKITRHSIQWTYSEHHQLTNVVKEAISQLENFEVSRPYDAVDRTSYDVVNYCFVCNYFKSAVGVGLLLHGPHVRVETCYCFELPQPDTPAELIQHVSDLSRSCRHHSIYWLIMQELAVQVSRFRNINVTTFIELILQVTISKSLKSPVHPFSMFIVPDDIDEELAKQIPALPSWPAPAARTSQVPWARLNSR